VGTKTITMYVSDIDQSEIPAGKVYQLSVRHPDGATQQLDISEKNYRALKLQNMGKTLKKRGRKPGSNTKATKATKAASTPPRAVGARASSGQPPPDGQQLDGPDRLLSADAARPRGDPPGGVLCMGAQKGGWSLKSLPRSACRSGPEHVRRCRAGWCARPWPWPT
jgi:hypothetical protein